MEGLDMDNILSPDEVETLFTDDNTEETQVTPPAQEGDNDKDKTTEVPPVNPDELFEEPESVGSEKVDTQGKENTNPDEGTGASPKANFYSSIASALKEEGILSDLDDETLGKIKTPEDFAEAVDTYLKNQLDERQRKIDEALQVGVEPDEIRQYESTIQYLDSITDEALSDESERGINLRKKLIFQDFINRGFSQERAKRETDKSFNAGTDVEDAKEARISNKEYFKQEYDDIINEAKEKEEAHRKELEKQSKEIRKSIIEDKEIFPGLELDKPTREKIYNSVSKPVYKDPETGEYLTAVQKYQRDNKVDFTKKLGLLLVMTQILKLVGNLTYNYVSRSLYVD